MKNMVNELTITNHNGAYVIDSRDVAIMVGKQHCDLMKKIKGYVEHLTQGNFAVSDFFIPSQYQDSTSRMLPCYLLTRKGCDMVANKMTGLKGTHFTATYVTKFEEMEKSLKELQPVSAPMSIEQMIIMQAQSMIDVKAKMELQEIKLTTLNHRIDNIDSLDTIGDLRQRLNKMIQKYARQNGIEMSEAWHKFVQAFNTAYHTNLNRLKSNYKNSHGMSKISTPEYLELTGRLEDGIRVADKMLN